MDSTWSRLKARADLLSATNNSFSPPYQSTSHGHLDVPRRSCCPTTPDPYNAATAPEFYPPAIPASLAASKTPASTTPASPAAIAPYMHPCYRNSCRTYTFSNLRRATFTATSYSRCAATGTVIASSPACAHHDCVDRLVVTSQCQRRGCKTVNFMNVGMMICI